MDIAEAGQAVITRSKIRVNSNHGWAAGRVGIALGYNAQYNSVKVGFLDESGEYSGDYTRVPVGSVDLITEEAPAATEPTTPRPAMKRINVTPKMVEALGNTIEINGKRGMIMSHPKTQAALVPRGLADEHGYLTDQGRFVAHLISLGTTDRAWSWDTIKAGTRTWLSDQARHAEAATEPVAEMPKTIKRVVNGHLVETDMTNTIRITGRMADALINTAVSEDERTLRLSLNVLVGTVVALMDRGFVEYNREMSRENGYPTHTFTPLGVAAQEQLVKESWGPNPKTFSREKLMAAAAKTSQPAAITAQSLADYCGEQETQTGYDYACTLSGPHDTHKAQGFDGETFYEWPAVTEYSVKIWYRSGAYEGAPHCPEELARKIYADAAASAGVEFAELHGPSGKLVASRGPSDGRDVSTDPYPNAPADNPFLPPAPGIDDRDAACVAGDED